MSGKRGDKKRQVIGRLPGGDLQCVRPLTHEISVTPPVLYT
jgi:hypothetical protein